MIFETSRRLVEHYLETNDWTIWHRDQISVADMEAAAPGIFDGLRMEYTTEAMIFRQAFEITADTHDPIVSADGRKAWLPKNGKPIPKGWSEIPKKPTPEVPGQLSLIEDGGIAA